MTIYWSLFVVGWNSKKTNKKTSNKHPKMSPFWNFTSFNDSRPSIFIIFKTGGTKRRSFCRRSRSLQRIFREELMEAKTKERRGEVPPVLVEPKKKCIKKWRVLEEDIYIYRLHFILELLWGFLVCMFFFLFLGGVAELVENTTFPIYFSYLSTVLIGWSCKWGLFLRPFL